MTQLFRKSLMLTALVAAFAVATAGSVSAQVAGTEFASVDDITVAADGEGFAVYNADTGEVFFSVGAGLQGFGARGLDGAVIVANVIADTAVALQQIDDSSVAGLTFSPAGFTPGVYNIGAILPADDTLKTAAEFAGLFPNANTAANTGFSAAFSVVPGSFVPPVDPQPGIPEPGSLSLLALAGLGAVARRRR